jgi:RNA polymerase sigma factor (sigma-70 family)
LNQVEPVEISTNINRKGIELMSKKSKIIEKDDKTIENYIDETVKKTVAEIKRQSMLKNNRQTPFQKTETLLYNYNNYKSAIKDKYEQINSIQCLGISKKSSSITSYSSGPIYDIKDDDDKAEEQIISIINSIRITENFIKIIDYAIDTLKDDEYSDIIRLKYFEEKSREEIAEIFDCDPSTISRNKNRLINLLQIRLFSDEVICQLFN